MTIPLAMGTFTVGCCPGGLRARGSDTRLLRRTLRGGMTRPTLSLALSSAAFLFIFHGVT